MCRHILPLSPVDIRQSLRMKAQGFQFTLFSLWQPDYCFIFNFYDFSWLQSLCWIDLLFQNHFFFLLSFMCSSLHFFLVSPRES